MAVKKIEELNVHRDVNSTEQFDVQDYLNENWDKMQDIVDNNAEELMQAQKDITTLKEDNKTNKSSIDVLEKSNETINKSLEDIDTKDKKQDEDIKANKESIEELQAENLEIKSENERLRNDIKSIALPGEASGESIHLEDSSDARCKIEIGGNHKQETREGYNILPYPFTDTTFQANGIKYTDLEDGSVNVNGTNTGYSGFALVKNMNFKAGTYTFYGTPNTNVDKNSFRIRLGDADNNDKLIDVVGNVPITLTFDKEMNINVILQVLAEKEITISNVVWKPMIILGADINKKYEQYGASPSFAYPSSVKAVGDVKNILNMSNAKGGTSGGITCNMIADGSYTYKGTASSKAINIWLLGSYNNKTSIFRLEPGTYYIDGVVLFDGNNVLANPDTAKIFTFINAHDITGVRALDAVLENTYDETKYPIIAEIDHEIPWVPYEMGYIKVNEFNKNYLSTIPQMSFSLQGIQTTFDGEKFICKGTAMYNYFNLTPKRIAHYFKVGTYTFSSNVFAKGRACIRFYYKDGTADTYYSNINTRKISFTLKKDAYEYFLMVDGLTVGGGDVIDCIIKLQLEDGNTATEIEKAENQEYLVDVQQPMFEGDTFVKQDAKWCEKHNWKTMSFDGQNMASQAGGTFADFKENGNIVRTFEIKDLLISSVRNDIFCDKLPRQADSMWNGKSTGIQSWQGQNKILISLPFDDVEKKYGQKLTVDNYVTAFYMYLQDEVLIISYPLEEPILLECTETQSKELDEIYNKAHTYKNITNISAESAEVNPTLNIKYLKDAETEHNKLQAQIDEIKQLLSTTETSALLVNNLEKDLRMEVE